MKSKSYVFAALLLICGIGAALVYANLDAVESALVTAHGHSHNMHGASTPSRGGDHLGCHRHGPVTYHCH